MTIRFSAATDLVQDVVNPATARGSAQRAANDNGWKSVIDCRLEAALRHFASHGMGAAQDAGARARAAYAAGDGENFRWWLDVCRQIDSRLARQLEQLELSASELELTRP